MHKKVWGWLFLGFLGCVHPKGSYPLKETCRGISEQMEQLRQERLGWMKRVAAWKWCRHKPIEDLERERQLLEAVVKQGKERGLQPTLVEPFFQGLIKQAKEAQRKAFAGFGLQAPDCALDDPQALSEIRSHLDKLNERFLESLQRAEEGQCK